MYTNQRNSIDTQITMTANETSLEIERGKERKKKRNAKQLAKCVTT